MKKNASIFLILLLLAIVPVTCCFLFSGDDEGEAEVVDDSDSETPADETASSRTAPSAAGGASAAAGSSVKVPVFPGYEDARYQKYDRLIAKYVEEFNRRTSTWAGSTPGQASAIKPLTAAQVKAHMIQETGGGDVRSRAAWAKDPLQVNVPGDWNPYKKYLGLKSPRKRNEGSLEKNLKAGIMLLTRKGFGVSGQPAANQPSGSFDGWKTSLRRYNGRSDKTADGRPYRDAYADRILQRANSLKKHVPIPIPTKRR